MGKTNIKKALSVFLSVLMIISCWVWVAPHEHTHANAAEVYADSEIKSFEKWTYNGITSAVPSFTHSSISEMEARRGINFQNILYSPQITGMPSEYGDGADPNSGTNAPSAAFANQLGEAQFAIYYPENTVVFVDGKNVVKIPVLAAGRNLNKNKQANFLQIYPTVTQTDTSDNKYFSLVDKWNGWNRKSTYHSTIDPANVHDGYIGHNSSTSDTGPISFDNYDSSRAISYYASTLTLNENYINSISNFNSNYYQSITLCWQVLLQQRSRSTTVSKWGSYGNLSGNYFSDHKIHVINYAPVVEILEGYYDFLTDYIAKNPDCPAVFVNKYIDAVNALKAIDITSYNYAGGASTAVENCANAIKNAIANYNTALARLQSVVTIDSNEGVHAGNLLFLSNGADSYSGGSDSSLSANVVVDSNGKIDISGSYAATASENERTLALELWVYLEDGKEYEFSYTPSNTITQFYLFPEGNTHKNNTDGVSTAIFACLPTNVNSGRFVCGDSAQGKYQIGETNWTNSTDATGWYQLRIDQDCGVNAAAGTYTVSDFVIKEVTPDTVNKVLVPAGETYVLADPERAGYNFTGWTGATNGSISNGKYTAAEKQDNLVANWELKQHTVKFVDIAGNVVSEKTYPYGTLAENIEVPANTAPQVHDINTHKIYKWQTRYTVTDDATYYEDPGDIDYENHTIVDTVVSPTCTTDGYTHHYCDICKGEYDDNIVPATGHNMQEASAQVDATCTVPGKTAVYTCANNCGHTTGGEVIAATGVHSYTVFVETVAPTCTDNGYTVYKCATCEATENRDSVSAAHTLVSVDAQAPTCTVDGWNAYEYCTKCDYTTKETDPATGVHSYTEFVETVAPTCTADGYTVYKCATCTAKENRDTVPAAHTLVSVDAQAPTCTEGGWNAYEYCSKCDYTTKVDLPKLGHTEGEAVVEGEVAATCTTDGKYDTVVYCTVCDAELSRVETIVNATGHKMREYVDAKYLATAATCTAPATYYKSCEVCGEKDAETFTDGEANGHSFTNYVYNNDAKCEVNGTETATCDNCTETNTRTKENSALEHIWSETYTDDGNGKHYQTCTRDNCGVQNTATVHTWGEGVVTPPTCTADGYTTYTCTANGCGATKTDTPVAAAHTPGEAVVENNVDPTCTTPGSYDTVVYCTVEGCGEEISRSKTTVDALGHDEIDHEAKVPTCTEIGWNAYVTCSRCDYTTYVEIPATNHAAKVHHEKVDATCIATGTIEYWSCPDCVKNFSNEACTTEVTELTIAIDSTNHVNKTEDNGTAATCTTVGYTAGTFCEDCDKWISGHETISAIAHKNSEFKSEIAATCTETGTAAHWYCPDCKKNFQNEACTIELTSLTIAVNPANHVNKTEHEQTDSTCLEVGYTAGTYCNDCKTWVSGHKEIPAIGHKNKVHHEKVDATCVATGTIEYWSCPDCKKNFSDEACATEVTDLIIEKDLDNHDLKTTAAKAPTCTEIGWDEYVTCQREGCDYTTYVEKEALGHKEEEIPAVDATCTETGLTAGVKCSVCGEILTAQEEISAKGHTLGEYISNADDKDGTHYQECTACDYQTEATAHTWDEGTVETAAKCTENGVMKYTCTTADCPGYYTEPIPATGHKDDDKNNKCDVCNKDICDHIGFATITTDAKSANCTEAGYTGDERCAECNTIKKQGEVIPALGHTKTHHEKVAAKCNAEGTIEYWSCSVCNKNFSDEACTKEVTDLSITIDATNHANVVTDAAVAATCYSYGKTEGSHCGACNVVIIAQTQVEKIAHTWNDGEETSAATCKTLGVMTYTCEVDECKATKTEDIALDANNHEKTTELRNYSKATCTAEGYTGDLYWACCNALDTKGNVIPKDATAHTTDATHVEGDFAATCTTPGQTGNELYDCCNAVKVASTTIPVDANAHTGSASVVKNAKDATCKEKGYTGDTHWSCCDALETKGSEIAIDASKHTGGDNVVKNAKVATCTEKGYTGDTYWSCCNALAKSGNEIAIDTTNHTKTTTHVEGRIEATCTTPGQTGNELYDCCNAVKVASTTIPVDATAHTTEETEVVGYVAATCTSTGATGDTKYKCCGAVKVASTTIPVDATAHTTEETEVVGYVAATCTSTGATGDTKYKCCGAVKVASTEIPVDATAHTTEETEVVGYVAPTCTTPGATGDTKYKCCGAVKVASTEIPVDATAHTTEETEVVGYVAPTCTTPGATGDTKYKCCGAVKVANTVISATGHTDGEAVTENNVAPDCENEGSYDTVVYCTVCGDELSRVKTTVDALGHTVVTDNAVEATCKSEGKTEGSHCSVCGNVLVPQEVIPTTTHSVVTDEAVAANCTEDGLTEGSHCSVCGTVIVAQEVIPSKGGHVFDRTKYESNLTRPQAGQPGYYTYPCKNEGCDATETEEVPGADYSSYNKVIDAVNKLMQEDIPAEDKAKLQEILDNPVSDRLTADEQDILDAAVEEITNTITEVYPDSGFILEIAGPTKHYAGTILGLEAVKVNGNMRIPATNVQWTSSDDSVVFFSNGKLIAIGTGTVTLTATSGLLTATKTITIVEGGNIRRVNFTPMANMHFIVEDYFAVFNGANMNWSDDYEIRFRVYTYSSFAFETYIVYINGVEAVPDEDGYYTVPANAGEVRVTVSGAVYDKDGEGSGGTGKFNFWEWLINLFRKIIQFFKDLFGVA